MRTLEERTLSFFAQSGTQSQLKGEEMRRRLSTPLITSALAATLAFSGSSGTHAVAPTQELAPKTAPQATSLVRSDKTVVEVWLADYPFPGYLKQRKALARQFNEKYPDIEIRVRPVAYTKLPGRLARAVSKGNAPAVANLYYSASGTAHDLLDARGQPWFQPVEEAIAGRDQILDEPVVTDDLLPVLKEQFSMDGQLVAQPVTAQTTLLFGNRSILRQAGIETMPRTWAQLRQACHQVMKTTKLSECVTWPNHNWFFQQAVTQQGQELFNHSNGRIGAADKTRFSNESVVKFARWWRTMAREGLYRYSGQQEDWGTSFNSFAKGRVAFVMDSSNQQATYASMGVATRVSPLPLPSADAPVANMNSGDALWLRNGLSQDERDAALAYMQFISSPKAMAKWHLATGYLPVTQSGADSLRSSGALRPSAAASKALRRMEQAGQAPQPQTAWTGAFDLTHNELLDAMHDVLTVNAPIRSRFKRADRRAQRLLTRYQSGCRAGFGPDHCYYLGPWG